MPQYVDWLYACPSLYYGIWQDQDAFDTALFFMEKQEFMIARARENYHTHTYYCKHATGSVADYCAAAVEKEMLILGISDHTPFPDDRWNQERMEYSQLQNYCDDIHRAQEKYPEIRILKSLECEYCPDLHAYYPDELLGKMELDYLVGAVHYFPFQGSWLYVFEETMNEKLLYLYAKHMIRTMETGYFSFMAHPDLFGMSYLSWNAAAESFTRDICSASKEYGVPLEINASGFRKKKVLTPDGYRNKFPLVRFWEIASEYDVRYIANSDAHTPEDVDAKIVDAVKFAEQFNLKKAEFSFARSTPVDLN